MKILVTGGTGFVGKALIKRLVSKQYYQVLASVRSITSELPTELQSVNEITPNTDWSYDLQDVAIVVHSAALAHCDNDSSLESYNKYRLVNTDGALNLAKQAANAGVRRFIFISTIKVNGEYTSLNEPFKADDQPRPIGPYAISKREAEVGLLSLSQATGMEVVIIRPPLVYGPNVKANFLTMMRWLSSGVPLPFGAIQNKRSLVGLDNLLDLIMVCLEHAAAAGNIFLVSDGEDLSTTELMRRTSKALDKPDRLFKVPQNVLIACMTIIGKGSEAHKLCSSLCVDITKTQQLLKWNPSVKVDEGVFITARHYLDSL